MHVIFRLLVLGVILLSAIHCEAQRSISGIVTVRKEPLPGVSVIIKGTNKGVTTDLDGHFEISIPDGQVVLVFVSVGLIPKEIFITDQVEISVIMEASCHKDYWDSEKFYLGISSGISKTPRGGVFGASFNAIRSSTLQMLLSYQEGNSKNQNIDGIVNLKHVYSPCNYNLDLTFRLRDITISGEDAFDFKAQEFISRHDFNRIGLEVGGGVVTFNSARYGAFALGVNKWIGIRGIGGLEPFYKTTLFESNLIHEIGVDLSRRGFNLVVSLNHLNNYQQANISLVYQFYQRRLFRRKEKVSEY